MRRWLNSLIQFDMPVGDTQVVERTEYKHIIILVTDKIIHLPGKVSDLLFKPLIKDAPNGFSKFGGALLKAGLLDDVDNREWLTVSLGLRT